MGNKSSQDNTNTNSTSLFSILSKSNPQDPLEDDPIVAVGAQGVSKGLDYDINEKLKVQVRGKFKCLSLKKAEKQIFPVMLSLITDQVQIQDNAKETNSDKPPIDLVCVIDRSGSMAGQKIQLVKDTLKMLTEFLTDKDRLCLVEFDDRATKLTGFKRINQQNINGAFKQAINQLNDRGETNINEGMAVALKAIAERKERNPVTSIFLLSDGQDSGAQARVANTLQNVHLEDTFTIHTFGFGMDHDSKLMTGIARLKNGNFYYIEQVDKVDECFIDALAGLVSVVAQNVTIKVNLTLKEPYLDCQITKYFGKQWQTIDGQKTIKLTNLISGVQKDFILELTIPPMDIQLGDMERNASLFEVSVSAQTVDLERTVTKTATLDITFYNENEEVPNYEEDPDVMFNYLRVHAAENIQSAREQADKGNYDQGQKLMDDVIQQMDSSKKVDATKLQALRKDVEQVKTMCQPQQFKKGGQHQFMQIEECWMDQKSKGVKFSSSECDLYENNVQREYKTKVLKRKGL